MQPKLIESNILISPSSATFLSLRLVSQGNNSEETEMISQWFLILVSYFLFLSVLLHRLICVSSERCCWQVMPYIMLGAVLIPDGMDNVRSNRVTYTDAYIVG